MRTAILTALLLTPVATATTVLVVIASGERLGATPFAEIGPRNSAEAAATGDAAAVVRFVRGGENPTRVYQIRPEIISSSVQVATTLEAALWSRRIEMVRLLDREGAIVGQDRRNELACLAADLDLPQVESYLAPNGVTCTPGEASARVMARTR